MTPLKRHHAGACWLQYRAVAMTIALASLTRTSDAQWTGTRSFFFPSLNMKHITGTSVDGTGAYMTAGTVFNYARSRTNTSNGIHWMHLDPNGNVLASKIIDENYFDERPVGIHSYGNDALIVATHRDETQSNSTTPSLLLPAGVEILRIDRTTAVPGARKVVTSTDPTYRNLYPLASLKLDDQLYVCGYATSNGNSAPANLATPKVAFLFRYDLPTNTLAAMRFIESAANPATNDFDMATCMKRISSGLWVGGSTNDGPMMNRIVNLLTLQDNPLTPATAIGAANPNAYENSYDVAETPNGDLYVFGNTYNINTGSAATPLLPQYTHITAVQPNLALYPGKSRWQFLVFDSPWGVNVLQDRNAPDYVVINGLGTNRMCSTQPLTTTSNINPFLAGMKLGVNTATGDINIVPQFWNTMLSYNGTGTSTLATSYYRLGNFMSTMLLPPVSAVRDYATSSDIVLTCPLWDNASRLSFKLIRADSLGRVPGCDWTPACGEIKGVLMTSLNGNPGMNAQASGAVADITNDVFDFRPTRVEDCSGHYRTASESATGLSESAAAPLMAAVYPNPAVHELNVELPDASGGSVRLFDSRGRLLTARRIPAGGRKIRLDLAAYPSGLYFYTIYHRGTIQSGNVSIQ